MRVANVVLNDFTRDNRVLKISRSLAEAGHEVIVVALHGEGLPLEEEQDGFRVVRTRIATSRLPRGTVFGALKMAELALRVVWRWRRLDAWHCNDVEAFVLGWCAQRLNPRLQLIYDCHEFEAERNAKPAFERKMVAWIERRMIRKASVVLTVSPSIAQAYRQRYQRHGVADVVLVRNVPEAPGGSATGPDPDHFRNRFGIPENAFIALYQGAFTYNRGLETALEAMRGLEDSGIHLVLMGYGPLQHLVDEAAARLPHVHVHPAVPYGQVLAHTRSADVGLVSVKPTCLSYLYCLPNKLFEYILAGLPVLSNDLPDCRALIEEFGAGTVVADDTPEGWRCALLDVRDAGVAQFAQGLSRAGESLSWRAEADRLLEAYSHLR